MHAALRYEVVITVRDAPGSTVLRVHAEKSVSTSEICICLWIGRISTAREAKGRPYSELSLAVSCTCLDTRFDFRAPKSRPGGGANVWYAQVLATSKFAAEQGLVTIC